ncbi:hypothetical protein GCM10009717_35710 [Agromyces allii]|uniref:Uncharacterized protein n=1 Tax=Agromyces allii TaxID=393607 RepID=A0ABN2R9L1_9MICO
MRSEDVPDFRFPIGRDGAAWQPQTPKTASASPDWASAGAPEDMTCLGHLLVCVVRKRAGARLDEGVEVVIEQRVRT